MNEQGLIDRVQPWMQGSTVEVKADPANERLVLEDAFDVRAADVEWQAGATAMPTFPDSVQSVIEGRMGLLTCSVSSVGGTYRVVLSFPVYEDGISKHAFMSALAELAKAHTTIERLVEGIKSQRALVAGLQEREQKAYEQLVEETRVPDLAPPAPVTGAWRRTHVVPDGGLQAWATPDPSAAPVATLSAGIELQLQEERGAWAHVAATNGWTGWVDGRRLVARP